MADLHYFHLSITFQSCTLVCFSTAACLACGNFVLSFPAQSDEILPELYPMFFHNLEDAIPSVRAGAAAALGSVVRAHGEGALAPVLSKVREGLQGLAQQPSDGADLIRSKQVSTSGYHIDQKLYNR